MRIDDADVYEQFVDARRRAVELTDAYHDTAPDDPRRAGLWEGVVQQTEVARGLLESWLDSSGPSVSLPLKSVDAPTHTPPLTANTASAGR